MRGSGRRKDRDENWDENRDKNRDREERRTGRRRGQGGGEGKGGGEGHVRRRGTGRRREITLKKCEFATPCKRNSNTKFLRGSTLAAFKRN